MIQTGQVSAFGGRRRRVTRQLDRQTLTIHDSRDCHRPITHTVVSASRSRAGEIETILSSSFRAFVFCGRMQTWRTRGKERERRYFSKRKEVLSLFPSRECELKELGVKEEYRKNFSYSSLKSSFPQPKYANISVLMSN